MSTTAFVTWAPASRDKFADELHRINDLVTAQEDTATADTVRETQVGLAAVPDTEESRLQGGDGESIDYGDPPPPPRPPTGRRLPKGPKRDWRYVLYMLACWVFCFIVGYVLGAGFYHLYESRYG